MNKPTKRWKISPMDLESRKHWADYSRAKDEMFAITDTKQAPWFVVNAEDKKCARLNVIRHLLSDDSLQGFDAGAAEAAAVGQVEVCAASDSGAALYS